MCGDVNLYLNDVDDHAKAEIEVQMSQFYLAAGVLPCLTEHMLNSSALQHVDIICSQFVCLLQIMVAEPGSRRRGIAREALLIMMLYGMEELVSLNFTFMLSCALLAT